MALERAQAKLAAYFAFPPGNAAQAKSMLDNYWKGTLTLPRDHEKSLLDALTIVSTSEMGRSHANDKKRSDRSRGQHIRKERTGSRKG